MKHKYFTLHLLKKILLKHIAFLLLFISIGTNCSAQTFHLEIIGSSSYENKIIDSLNYNSIHRDVKSIFDEINSTSARLLKIGYIEVQTLENIKKNDSAYVAKLYLGNKINSTHIYIGRNSELIDLLSLNTKNDTIILPYTEIETFLNNSIEKLEQKGYSFAKLKLVNIQKKKNTLYADLQFESDQQRKLNAIVVKYENSNKKNSFPEGHLKQMNRKYHNLTFNQEVVRKIQEDFDKFRFVNQIKNPEILFTKDTTNVYVYLENRKSNTFDGYLGFANNENSKLVFNGYLDLALENTLKAGELFSLYWKSDGNNQKTFKTSIDIPYLFKSPIGLKAQLYIFKQDSIFQNTKTNIDLGYFIDYNTRIYIGYQSTESSDIQNTNNSTISDFKNSFLTANLEYSKLDYENKIFPKKTNCSISLGLGKRETSDLTESVEANKQSFININAMHNFYLNKKNCFNINYQNYFLKSNTYLINELFRFGGINSIRGFAENSLQGNFMTALITEYRYIISPNLYAHSILDYGYFEDKSTSNNGTLLGIGFGIGLQTNNGILKIAISNGKTTQETFKFNNSIISIKYNIEF